VKVFIYDTVCFKNSLYEFVSALFVQMSHYFVFSIQLVMLRVFNVKVKNLAFDTSTNYHKCMIFYMKNYVRLVQLKYLP